VVELSLPPYKLFTFVRRLFTYVYSINCYDWEREEVYMCWRWSKWRWCTLDNASYSAFSFLFLKFFIFCCFLFLFWFVLSFYWFRSSVFFLLRLCLFACVSFLICYSKGESRGGLVYLEAKLVLVRWLASAFLSLFLFFLCLLSDLPSLGHFFFVALFSCFCSSFLSPSVCIVHSLCSLCPLCVCPLFLFLFVLCLSPGSFLFSFPLFSFFVRASVMACIMGARRMLPRFAAISTESGWRRWTVCFETAPIWAEAVILQFSHWNYDILPSGTYSWKILFFFKFDPWINFNF